MTRARLELVQGIARAYTTPKNAAKTLDPDLCQAIEAEIAPAFELAVGLVKKHTSWLAYEGRWCNCPIRIGDPRQDGHSTECDTVDVFLKKYAEPL